MARARSASFHAAPVRRSSSTFGLPSRNSFTGRSAEPSIVNIESMDASSVSILSPSGAANVSSRSLPGTQPAAETLDLPAETRSTNSSFHNSPRRIAVSPLRMTSGTTGDYVFSPVSRRTSIDVDTAELNLNTDQQDVANLLAVSPIFNGLARDALAVLTANGRRQEVGHVEDLLAVDVSCEILADECHLSSACRGLRNQLTAGSRRGFGSGSARATLQRCVAVSNS